MENNKSYVKIEEVLNNHLIDMINVLFNSYVNDAEAKRLGIEKYNYKPESNRYNFEMKKVGGYNCLFLNGRMIQSNVWGDGKLLRRENRLKLLSILDYQYEWENNLSEQNESTAPEPYTFMKEEIVNTISSLIIKLHTVNDLSDAEVVCSK